MDNNSISIDWKNSTDPVLRKKARQKAYYETHKTETLARTKAYYEKNKHRISIRSKIYRQKNKEKIIAIKNIYYEANKEKIKIGQKIYRQKNRAKILPKKIAYANANKHIRRAWLDANRHKINEYNKNRLQTNIQHKIAKQLRIRLWDALRGNVKVGSAVKHLGCSIEEFKKYLESKFQEGMTWDNWTNDGWHIDHIKPLSSFDLTDRDQFLQACHYTNLQPLWAKDNFSKGDKIL